MRTDVCPLSLCPLSHAVTLPRELGDGTGELISTQCGLAAKSTPLHDERTAGTNQCTGCASRDYDPLRPLCGVCMCSYRGQPFLQFVSHEVLCASRGGKTVLASRGNGSICQPSRSGANDYWVMRRVRRRFDTICNGKRNTLLPFVKHRHALTWTTDTQTSQPHGRFQLSSAITARNAVVDFSSSLLLR